MRKNSPKTPYLSSREHLPPSPDDHESNPGLADDPERRLMSKREPPKDTSATANRLAHSIADAAKITGVGRSFLYEEINAGRLKVRKAGRRSLIFESDLRQWLASLPAKNADNAKINP